MLTCSFGGLPVYFTMHAIDIIAHLSRNPKLVFLSEDVIAFLHSRKHLA